MFGKSLVQKVEELFSRRTPSESRALNVLAVAAAAAPCGANHARASEREASRERSNTSAERSEAREDDVPRLLTCRVASPLVMATLGSCAEFNRVRLTRRGHLQVKPLPLASQGGSATRNDERRPRQLLRLRCAPPSATPIIAHASACATPSARSRASHGVDPPRTATSTRPRQTPFPCATSNTRPRRESASRTRVREVRGATGSSRSIGKSVARRVSAATSGLGADQESHGHRAQRPADQRDPFRLQRAG